MIIFWPHDLMIMTSGGAQGFSGLGEREVGNTGNFLGELGSKLIFWGCREPRGYSNFSAYVGSDQESTVHPPKISGISSTPKLYLKF